MQAQFMCTLQRIWWTCVVLWPIAAAFAAPYAILHGIWFDIEGSAWHCAQKRELKDYKIVESIVFYLIPLCVFSVLYGRISCVLWGLKSWRNTVFIRILSVQSISSSNPAGRIRIRIKVSTRILAKNFLAPNRPGSKILNPFKSLL